LLLGGVASPSRFSKLVGLGHYLSLSATIKKQS